MTDVAQPLLLTADAAMEAESPQIDVGHSVPADVYRRRWAILGVLNLSLLIVVIANTSLNVALPTMARDLEPSNSAQQWVVDADSIVFAGLLLTGRLARRPVGAQALRPGRHRRVRVRQSLRDRFGVTA